MDRLSIYEKSIKEFSRKNGTRRNNFFAVDSTHLTNPSLHENPDFQPLVEKIYANAASFLHALGCSNDFIKRMHILNMWSNISHKGDFVGPHIHSNSILSGVYYVKKFSGSKIKFYKNIYENIKLDGVPNDLSYTSCDYDCDPGRLLIWKSDVLHGTDQQSSGEKIAVSFNIAIN